MLTTANLQGRDSVPLKHFFPRVTDINDITNELEVFHHTLDDPNQRSGEFKWKVPSSNVDYLTRTFVKDSHKCRGLPPYVVKGNVMLAVIKNWQIF